MTDDVSVSHENKQPFERIEVEGELDEVLSSEFSLIQLRRGGKALLRKRRLYVEGSLPGDWSWDDVRGRMLYCKVRKVDCGTASVNHQVAYAHTAMESNHGNGGSPALIAKSKSVSRRGRSFQKLTFKEESRSSRILLA